MSGTVELAELSAAIEQSARLLDVPFSRDRVEPILAAYGSGEALAGAVIAFRVATGARHVGDLDCRFIMLPKETDPYETAVSRRLLPETDHPAGDLVADLRAGFPIDSHGIDFGVVGGVKKTWTFFPADRMQRLTDLAGLASMPAGIGAHADFFARYDLADKASLIGIDHPHRTVNVYFGTPPAACFEPATIRSMLRGLGLPEPSAQLLALGEQAFGIYVTLGWDSPGVDRVTYAVMTPDPLALPVPVAPRIERFVTGAPYAGASADRRFVYAITASTGGEYQKLQSYYRWRPRMLDVMLLPADPVGAPRP